MGAEKEMTSLFLRPVFSEFQRHLRSSSKALTTHKSATFQTNDSTSFSSCSQRMIVFLSHLLSTPFIILSKSRNDMIIFTYHFDGRLKRNSCSVIQELMMYFFISFLYSNCLFIISSRLVASLFCCIISLSRPSRSGEEITTYNMFDK